MEKTPQLHNSQKPADRRRAPRTEAFGRQTLSVTFVEKGANRVVESTLCDFSESGLGMESRTRFVVGETVEITGKLINDAYSVELTSTGKIVYCTKNGANRYRSGVMFKDVTLRPVMSQSERPQ